MSEKPRALLLAFSILAIAMVLTLSRQHAEIKRLRADNERLRGLLREAREYLPEHHPIAESLFPRIDAAMEPDAEPAIRAQGEVPR
jgi:hypothetical protein